MEMEAIQFPFHAVGMFVPVQGQQSCCMEWRREGIQIRSSLEMIRNRDATHTQTPECFIISFETAQKNPSNNNRPLVWENFEALHVWGAHLRAGERKKRNPGAQVHSGTLLRIFAPLRSMNHDRSTNCWKSIIHDEVDVLRWIYFMYLKWWFWKINTTTYVVVEESKTVGFVEAWHTRNESIHRDFCKLLRCWPKESCSSIFIWSTIIRSDPIPCRPYIRDEKVVSSVISARI